MLRGWRRARSRRQSRGPILRASARGTRTSRAGSGRERRRCAAEPRRGAYRGGVSAIPPSSPCRPVKQPFTIGGGAVRRPGRADDGAWGRGHAPARGLSGPGCVRPGRRRRRPGHKRSGNAPAFTQALKLRAMRADNSERSLARREAFLVVGHGSLGSGAFAAGPASVSAGARHARARAQSRSRSRETTRRSHPSGCARRGPRGSGRPARRCDRRGDERTGPRRPDGRETERKRQPRRCRLSGMPGRIPETGAHDATARAAAGAARSGP